MITLPADAKWWTPIGNASLAWGDCKDVMYIFNGADWVKVRAMTEWDDAIICCPYIPQFIETPAQRYDRAMKTIKG